MNAQVGWENNGPWATPGNKSSKQQEAAAGAKGYRSVGSSGLESPGGSLKWNCLSGRDRTIIEIVLEEERKGRDVVVSSYFHFPVSCQCFPLPKTL